MSNLMQPDMIISLIMLIGMELVLGMDNLLFISIMSNRLPQHLRMKARILGISLALCLRIGLLFTISFIVSLTVPVFEFQGHAISWRDVILVSGGLFLVWKSATEMSHQVKDHGSEASSTKTSSVQQGFAYTVMQIILLDLVFSVDSIITAVGISNHVAIMVTAVIIAVSIMMLASTVLSEFLAKNPSLVLLVLGFLMMIGLTLIADGFSVEIPKNYLYIVMAIAFFSERTATLYKRHKANGQSRS